MMFKKLQQSDGTLYYRNYTDGTPPDDRSVCGSAVSFSGIIWLRLYKLGYGEDFPDRIHLSARRVVDKRFAEDHPDPNLRGAFVNTRMRMQRGVFNLVNRDIGTAFGVRFLSDYYDYSRASTDQ